jgi:hypothetical protein
MFGVYHIAAPSLLTGNEPLVDFLTQKPLGIRFLAISNSGLVVFLKKLFGCIGASKTN